MCKVIARLIWTLYVSIQPKNSRLSQAVVHEMWGYDKDQICS